MPAPPPPAPVLRAVLATRRRLLRLADALLPADFVTVSRVGAIHETTMLGTVCELGVADALAGGPATAAELARRLDLDPDALHRVLRALAVHGFFRLDRRGRFRLTRTGRTLRRDADGSMSAWARYMALGSTREAFAMLTHTVRTGEPSFPAAHGCSVWAWFAAHPEEERLFAAAMRRLTQLDLPSIAGAGVWPEAGRVCDVAGGVGTLLAGILERRPRLQGVLVDAPGVLAEADGVLTQAGVRERVELVEGDFFGGIEAEADVYVMKDILHDWDDDRCRSILRVVRGAMRPGARLVLVEMLLEPNEVHPVTCAVDVQMLTQCDGGRQRSAAELHALLRATGFTPAEVHTPSLVSLVEAVAA